MRYEKPATGAAAGIAVSSVLAAVAQPIIGVAAGAVAAFAVVFRQDVLRPYATVGTAWALGLAVVLFVVPIYSPAYRQSTFFSLLVIGLMSAGVLGLRKGIKSLVSKAVEKRVGDEETAEKSGRTAASIVGTLVLAWSILNAKERLARSGIVGLLAPVTFVLDLIGFSVQIPWILEDGINLTLFLFVGSVVVGFHTLSSWHATLLLKDDENVRAAGRKAKQGVSTAGTKSKQKAGEARETLSAKLSAAREEVQSSDDDASDDTAGTATDDSTAEPVEPVAETTADSAAETAEIDEPAASTAADSAADAPSSSGDEARCLSCDAAVDPTVRFCPSCGAESPTEAATDAEEPGTREPTPEPAATPTDSASPAVAAAAQDIERRINPDSDAARTLCRTLANRADDADELRSALEATIQALDRRESVVSALDPVDSRATDGTLERAEQALEAQPTQLSTAVGALVDRLRQAEAALEDQTADRETLADDIDTVCSAAAAVDGVTVGHGDDSTRLQQVASAFEAGELTARQPTTTVESVVRDSSVPRPNSPVARDLYAALRDPSDETAIRSALDESVALLDEYAETQELLSEISERDIRTRIDSLSRELQQRDSTVYSQLGNRVRELEATLDGQTDDIQRYAIYQEVLFYDRTLVPQLSRSSTGADGAADELADSIQREIDEIEREYVSVRADHDHAIPRHFLELADDLATDARQDMRRHPDRATGVLTGTEAILENVRELYDRNEYSVMLRRLQH